MLNSDAKVGFYDGTMGTIGHQILLSKILRITEISTSQTHITMNDESFSKVMLPYDYVCQTIKGVINENI